METLESIAKRRAEKGKEAAVRYINLIKFIFENN